MLLQDMCSAITMKGGRVSVVLLDELSADTLPEEGTTCVFTLGGDGTLIRAAQRISQSKVPLLGVNRGHLGYLCDLDGESVFEAIDRLLVGDFEVEERMMLCGEIQDEKGHILHGARQALNDIVISSRNALQVIHLSLYVEGELLYSFDGDGMIFATPTGSTAYNLSAHGPIVDPVTQLILMTPINPHTLSSRSMVLDAKEEIALELVPRRRYGEESVGVSFDGGSGQEFHAGERLLVRRAKETVRIVRLTKMNFLERIRKKLKDE